MSIAYSCMSIESFFGPSDWHIFNPNVNHRVRAFVAWKSKSKWKWCQEKKINKKKTAMSSRDVFARIWHECEPKKKNCSCTSLNVLFVVCWLHSFAWRCSFYLSRSTCRNSPHVSIWPACVVLPLPIQLQLNFSISFYDLVLPPFVAHTRTRAYAVVSLVSFFLCFCTRCFFFLLLYFSCCTLLNAHIRRDEIRHNLLRVRKLNRIRLKRT